MATITRSEETDGFPLLQATELPRFLTDPQLRHLEQLCRPMSRRPGATVYRQGDAALTLYLVGEGSVELRARPPGRRVYRTVEVVGAGCTFGDEAVFGEATYLTGARMLERTRMLALSLQAFQRLAHGHPDIATAILRSSGSCLLRTFRRATILTQAPAGTALRMLLSELAEGRRRRNGDVVTLRVTHAQLAGLLHLSRETVSRMLGALAEEGLVELGRGAIRLRRT